jgi:hypothetical protein
MGVGIAVVQTLFEPLSNADRYVLRDATTWALGRQDKTMLVSGIVSWTDTVFNSEQVPRLVQELRAIGRQEALDDRARTELEGAAEFVEREVAGKSQCFVVFLGN